MFYSSCNQCLLTMMPENNSYQIYLFKHAPKSVERQSDFCLHKCSASSFNVYFRDSAIFISGETKVQNFSFRLHFQCRNNTRRYRLSFKDRCFSELFLIT